MFISIIGETASGKSHIVKKLISSGVWNRKTFKDIPMLISSSHKLVIIGRYTQDGIFQGSDLISSSSRKNILLFVRKFKLKYFNYNFLIEGSKFNTVSFYKEIPDVVIVFKVVSSKENLYLRRMARRYDHSEKYISKVRNKIKAVEKEYDCIELKNDNEKSLNNSLNKIKKLVFKNKTKVR